MIRAEEKLELRELVVEEVSRIISPRNVLIFAAVIFTLCGLSVWKTFELWSVVTTQNYVIDGLERQVMGVTMAKDFTEALNANTDLTEANTKLTRSIASHLGVEIEVAESGGGGGGGEPDQ